MHVSWIWTQFFAIALVIGFAGYQLSYYADLIAERTGLGRNWIGLILLATITSLPELMSGVSAVAFADSPDLAVGDILGSCVFNLTLVFLLDLLYRESSVYSRATQGHILSAAFGIVLMSFIGFGIAVGGRFTDVGIGHMGAFTVAIPFFYILAMRNLYAFERRTSADHAAQAASSSGPLPPATSGLSSARIYGLFGLAALVVVAAGAGLPFVGERIVEAMGWNEAFVGTMFIALATSVPEIAVTISAIRLRAVELAFSNLLGSNLFNAVILTVDDLFYLKGPLFQHVSQTHVVTAISAVMMTGLVLVGLIQSPSRRVLQTVSAMSLLLVLVYAINAYVVFKMGF